MKTVCNININREREEHKKKFIYLRQGITKDVKYELEINERIELTKCTFSRVK